MYISYFNYVLNAQGHGTDRSWRKMDYPDIVFMSRAVPFKSVGEVERKKF